MARRSQTSGSAKHAHGAPYQERVQYGMLRSYIPVSLSLLSAVALAGLIHSACGSSTAPSQPGAATKSAPSGPDSPPKASDGSDQPALQLVESWPVGTALDHPDIADAHDVWVAMIDSAERTIDIEEFYGSNRSPSRLDAVIAALGRAAARGVTIRLLFGERFYSGLYPEVPDQLAALPGAKLRIIDVNKLTGGVQHAKFFIIDGRDAYLGSQNFDWRSLTHIQELGVRIRQPQLCAEIVSVFELDWRLAGAGDEPLNNAGAAPAGGPIVTVEYRGQPVEVRPGASPKGLLPHDDLWDLPPLIAMFDGARDRIRVQLLSYDIKNYDGSMYRGLDTALRRAAARGVKIELLLADWNKRAKSIVALQDLQRLDNVTVKLMTIPEHESGFIPFARVIHAKLATVDGQRSWVSTSNFAGDYFHKSRNLSLLFTGAAITQDLDGFFATGWSSEYVHIVEPDRDYEPPRIAE